MICPACGRPQLTERPHIHEPSRTPQPRHHLPDPANDETLTMSGYDWWHYRAAIEREAVAAYLASPQAAEELARALYKHMADFATDPESYGDPAKVAANILAALRDLRDAS